MKLTVPYYSQFVDVTDSFWMIRACGAACFKMVGEFEGLVMPDITAFCNEAKAVGGYDMENGWVHDYIVRKAKALGLEAYRKEGLTECDELLASIDAGHPVIVSVEKRVLEQKRFHMIVLTGYEQEGESITKLYYHEPESTNKEKGKHRKVDLEVFMNYWRGKAIFISKKQS